MVWSFSYRGGFWDFSFRLTHASFQCEIFPSPNLNHEHVTLINKVIIMKIMSHDDSIIVENGCLTSHEAIQVLINNELYQTDQQWIYQQHQQWNVPARSTMKYTRHINKVLKQILPFWIPREANFRIYPRH